MLKKRFRILHDEMRVPTEKVSKLILASMILHNITVDMKMPPFSGLDAGLMNFSVTMMKLLIVHVGLHLAKMAQPRGS